MFGRLFEAVMASFAAKRVQARDYTPEQIAQASDAWLIGLCDEINRAERARFNDLTITETIPDHPSRIRTKG